MDAADGLQQFLLRIWFGIRASIKLLFPKYVSATRTPILHAAWLGSSLEE
jgi:hypothetical protein